MRWLGDFFFNCEIGNRMNLPFNSLLKVYGFLKEDFF